MVACERSARLQGTAPSRWLRYGFSIAAVLSGLLAAAAASAASPGQSAPSGGRVVQVAPVTGLVNAGTARLVDRAVQTAEDRGATALVLTINTDGGYERATQEVVQRLQRSSVPVVVYVAPAGARARAAGFFIAQAGDVLVMAPGTSLGGAAVGAVPAEGGPALHEVATSASGLAQQRGRNAAWAAQAVLDGDVLPAGEAVRIKAVDEVASDLEDLLAKLDGRQVSGPWGNRQLATRGATVDVLGATPVEQALSALIDPNVAYLLFVIGLYGIIVEMAAPGVSVPGVVGVICALLSLFAFSQLPVNWVALGILSVAAALLVGETQFPAHGLLAVAGTGTFVAGSILLFRPPAVAPYGAAATLNPWLVATLTATSAVVFGWLIRQGLSALHWPELNAAPGAGDIAVAGSVVESTGTVHLHGETWSAEWPAGTVRPGQRVRVVGRRGLTLLVEPLLEERSE